MADRGVVQLAGQLASGQDAGLPASDTGEVRGEMHVHETGRAGRSSCRGRQLLWTAATCGWRPDAKTLANAADTANAADIATAETCLTYS
jgi:hypothetical protein